MSVQTGYREGLEEGKELTLQHGFNAGMPARNIYECIQIASFVDSTHAMHSSAPGGAVAVAAVVQCTAAACMHTSKLYGILVLDLSQSTH